MKIDVVTTKTFDLAELNGKLEFARHLANSGVRNIAPSGGMKNVEFSIPGPLDEEGNATPAVITNLPTPYAYLINSADNVVIAEKSMLDPEIGGFLVICGAMIDALARVWHARLTERTPGARSASGGTGRRGRKSNAQKEAEQAQKEAGGAPVESLQTATPSDIVQKAIAAQNAKKAAK